MTLNSLVKEIEKLRRTSVKKTIDKRMEEFEAMQTKPIEDIFSELCFCIMTANFSAEGGIKIQKALCNQFLGLRKEALAKKLKGLGHRFPNTRANYIHEARAHKDVLKKHILEKDELEFREWLAENVKGLGYKEASHFMRNIGYKNVAIVDFHIVDLLVRYGLIERPKTLTKKRYLEIENILKKIGEKAKINLAELDLYLWYMETKKILK